MTVFVVAAAADPGFENECFVCSVHSTREAAEASILRHEAECDAEGLDVLECEIFERVLNQD